MSGIPSHYFIEPSPQTNGVERTDNHDIELETALEELVLNLLGDGVETNVGLGTNLLDFWGGHSDGHKVRKKRCRKKSRR